MIARRFPIACMFAGLVALMAADLSAQGQAQGRNQGFRGRLGGGGSIAGLLMVEEVRQELQLSEEKMTEIREMMREMRQANAQRTGQRGNFSEMTQEERAAMRARMQQQNQATRDALAKILSTEQMTRLSQIFLQQQGAGALAQADVAAALKLSEEQQAKISKLLDDFRQAARPARNAGADATDRQAVRQQMRQRNQQLDQDIMAILTTDQQAKLKELKGTAFEMPQRAGRGGGGARRGGQAPASSKGDMSVASLPG